MEGSVNKTVEGLNDVFAKTNNLNKLILFLRFFSIWWVFKIFDSFILQRSQEILKFKKLNLATNIQWIADYWKKNQQYRSWYSFLEWIRKKVPHPRGVNLVDYSTVSIEIVDRRNQFECYRTRTLPNRGSQKENNRNKIDGLKILPRLNWQLIWKEKFVLTKFKQVCNVQRKNSCYVKS